MAIAPPPQSLSNPIAHAAPKTHRLRHIPELDGIRGIAALMVFCHHALTTFNRETLQGRWPGSIQAISRAAEYGKTGVDLFFVLSGFLITSILLGEQRSRSYYRDFYWKRALRILPLYLLTLAVAWLAFRQTAYTFLALAFLVNFGGLLHMHIIQAGPFWSLGIEEQFYVLWPTVVRRFTVRRILDWSLAIGISCIGLRFLLALHHHHNYDLTPLRCDGLAFGAALACHFHRAPNTRARRSIDPLLCALAVAGALLLGLCAHTGIFYTPAIQTAVTLLAVAFIGLAISHSGSRWLAIFRSRMLTFFGLISYAFYMVHIYIIMLYQHFHGPLPPGDVRGYWIEILVTFIASVLLSLVTRYTIELPAMRMRKHVLKHYHSRAEEAIPPLPLAQM